MSNLAKRLAALTPEKRETFLRQMRKKEKGTQEQILPQARASDGVPLSFAQQRLWFLDQFEGASPLYIIPTAMRVQGALNVAALEQSLGEIVQRHEALRTTFPTVAGRPVQRISPSSRLLVPVVDATALPVSLRQAQIQRLVQEEASSAFDLAEGPLLRARLLRVDQQEHVLLLSLHHIVADGWSIGVLLHELSILYASCSAAEPSPLPPLPIQYADFALWQRAYLQGEVLQTHLSYWQEQLRGAPPVLSLPTDRPRPAMQTFRGARQVFALPRTLSERLTRLSQQEGVTLFMTLLAAWQTLLWRYSDQQDLVVGTPIANRTHPQLEDLIGCFVNTLVLRTDLSGNPSFSALLGRVREVCLGAYAHQDLPFEHLVEALQPRRDLSHPPLFQVMFILQNTPMQDIELPGLRLLPLDLEGTTARFELTLVVQETEAGLEGVLEYNSDLFEAVTIAHMAGHWQTLLQAIVVDPQQPISRLSLLTEKEQQQMLSLYNTIPAVSPQRSCLHELFEAQVQRSPEAIALVWQDEQLSYRELNERANQLAHHLHTYEVGPEMRVGLCLDRSSELVVGLLAILKAGGTFVPLDPAYPAQRLAFLLADAQVSVVLTHERLRHRLTGTTVPMLCLDLAGALLARASRVNPVSGVTAEHLAYVLYTSGSTGQPKGVAIEHRSTVALLHWARQIFATEHLAGVLASTSICFDLSIFELFVPLSWGGKIILAENALHLPTLPAASMVTLVNTVPTAMRELLRLGGIPDSVRVINLAGEPLSERLVQQLYERETVEQVFNLYGPSEDTTYSTVALIEKGSQQAPPIGHPIVGTAVYLLDSQLQLVPRGVPGELYLGGAGQARGYLHRPGLTAEKFVPHPFSSLPGARLYKTGDLARYRLDGRLEFLGRRDSQVKLRGYRIELAEIEATLKSDTRVQEAVVVVREDAPGDKRLVAYVVVGSQQQVSTKALRELLQQKLPDYLIPASFVLLEALPVTPTGKLDRRALPVPGPARPELEEQYVPPRTPEEKILVGIWSGVLGLKQVGIHDNFFELGGDSILSLQIIHRAYQAGLHLLPKQLFQHQTIAELAAAAGTTPTIQIAQELVTGPVPLTPIQRWFFEQPFADLQHWNQAMFLQVPHDLYADLLELSIAQLLLHHDALRLRFRQQATGWEQSHAPIDGAVPLTRVDLSTLPEAAQSSAIESIAAQTQANLNLSEGPLLRGVLFIRRQHQPRLLLLVIHHLVIDGVSWRILLENLQMVYQQQSQGETVHLPPKTISFQQWATHLTQYAQSARLLEEAPYWLHERRRDVPPMPLDFDAGRSFNTEEAARSVNIALSTEETNALLHEVPASYHTQISEVLLTALTQTWASWTGRRKLLVNIENHGRQAESEEIDSSRTVGWFTALYPQVLDLEMVSARSGPGTALKAIKEQVRGVPHNGLGYGLLRYLSRHTDIQIQLEALPQAEICFNYLGQFDNILQGSTVAMLSAAHETAAPSRSLRNYRSHLLDITCLIVAGSFQVQWIYCSRLHRHETIEFLAQHYIEALRRLIAHCRTPEASEYTPSDFQEVELNQAKIDKIMSKLQSRNRSSLNRSL